MIPVRDQKYINRLIASLKNFQNSVETLNTVGLLQTFLDKHPNPAYSRYICEQGAIDILIALINEPKTWNDTQERAISTVMYLVSLEKTADSNASKYINNQTIDILIRLIKRTESSDFTRGVTVGLLLGEIEGNPEAKKYISNQAFVDVLIDLIKHKKNPGLIRIPAITLLFSVIEDNSEAPKYISNQDFVDILIDLINHKENPDFVQSAAIGLLSIAVKNNPINQAYFCEQSGIEICIAILKNANSSDDMQTKTLFLLISLIKNNPKNQVYFREQSGIELCIAILKNVNSSDNARVNTLSLLNCSVEGSPINQAYFCGQGGIELCIAILKNANSSDDMQTNTFLILDRLVNDNPANQAYFCEQGGIEICIDALKHSDKTHGNIFGFLISLVKNNPTNQAYFREQGGIELCIDTVKHSDKMHGNILGLLNCLVNDNPTNQAYFREQGGIEICIDTVKNPNSSVQTKAQAIRTLKSFCPGTSSSVQVQAQAIIDILHEESELNNPVAMLCLIEVYTNEVAVAVAAEEEKEENNENLFDLCNRLITFDNTAPQEAAAAMLHLAAIHYAKNNEEAANEWLIKASKFVNTAPIQAIGGLFALANMHRNKPSDDTVHKKTASNYYMQILRLSDKAPLLASEAMICLAAMYENDEITPPTGKNKYECALSLYKKAINLGSLKAQNYAALLYKQGKVKSDEKNELLDSNIKFTKNPIISNMVLTIPSSTQELSEEQKQKIIDELWLADEEMKAQEKNKNEKKKKKSKYAEKTAPYQARKNTLKDTHIVVQPRANNSALNLDTQTHLNSTCRDESPERDGNNFSTKKYPYLAAVIQRDKQQHANVDSNQTTSTSNSYSCIVQAITPPLSASENKIGYVPPITRKNPESKLTVSSNTAFVLKSNPVVQKETLSDGNCMYNACALFLVELLSRLQPKYASWCIRTRALLKNISISGNQAEVQKRLAPLLREAVIDYMQKHEKYYRMHYGERLAILFDTLVNENKIPDDDTFWVHDFIKNKINKLRGSRDSNQAREALCTWWNEEGFSIYLITMKQSAQSGGDEARWGGSTELDILGKIFHFRIYIKTDQTKPHCLGEGIQAPHDLSTETKEILKHQGLWEKKQHINSELTPGYLERLKPYLDFPANLETHREQFLTDIKDYSKHKRLIDTVNRYPDWKHFLENRGVLNKDIFLSKGPGLLDVERIITALTHTISLKDWTLLTIANGAYNALPCCWLQLQNKHWIYLPTPDGSHLIPENEVNTSLDVNVKSNAYVKTIQISILVFKYLLCLHKPKKYDDEVLSQKTSHNLDLVTYAFQSFDDLFIKLGVFRQNSEAPIKRYDRNANDHRPNLFPRRYSQWQWRDHANRSSVGDIIKTGQMLGPK